MAQRFDSLEAAIADMGAGTDAAGRRIVVSWAWWDALSEPERDTYRARCADRAVRLTADHRISRHFVEVADVDEPPLSSEHAV
jgi:hypothetical protein